jgi:hypothetical protein
MYDAVQEMDKQQGASTVLDGAVVKGLTRYCQRFVENQFSNARLEVSSTYTHLFVKATFALVLVLVHVHFLTDIFESDHTGGKLNVHALVCEGCVCPCSSFGTCTLSY